MTDDLSQFKKLKAVCVPLLKDSLITPATVPTVSRLLSELQQCLQQLRAEGAIFSPSELSYIFFPISTMLTRNPSTGIPDQILEKILDILGNLCEDWWWSCDMSIWEQIFMLCGGIVSDLEGKGKRKPRDDETKEAAARCLHSLLRPRSAAEGSGRPVSSGTRLEQFQVQARDSKFDPIVGQSLNALLVLAESSRRSLQLAVIDLTKLLIDTYLADELIPSILPGVVSTLSKAILGTNSATGWVNGSIVASGLSAMQVVIVRSVGDAVCKRDGAIREVVDLEDFSTVVSDTIPDEPTNEQRSFRTRRTASWLNGVCSQLHIALNCLTPLVKHPTPSALSALAEFSGCVLAETPSTLPQSQTLLLSFLLSLSISEFPSVTNAAERSLLTLLGGSSGMRSALLPTLVKHTRENLSSLARLLQSQADAKVEHIAGLVTAFCNLSEKVPLVSAEIGKLLGPSGGIERWGWGLLSVLQFDNPPITTVQTQFLLEMDGSSTSIVPFPEITLRNLATRSAYDAVERMFRSLGTAAGEACLSAIEWFAAVGQNGTSGRSVAALWCASHLLEGAAHVDLNTANGPVTLVQRQPLFESFSRDLAKSIARLWEGTETVTKEDEPRSSPDEPSTLEVLHVQGIQPIHEMLKIMPPSSQPKARTIAFPSLHRGLCLRIIAVISGILNARFSSLLLYTLYPLLHSLVSSDSHISSSAMAALKFITSSTSHASPAHLLMSNFDYALDSVSRRLSRRWLDVDATKVFVVVINIIGHDVVERAGDVVEECFDRLDEFHGYTVLVEGLVEVLSEIVKVVKDEQEAGESEVPMRRSARRMVDAEEFHRLFGWLEGRDKQSRSSQEEPEGYRPAPRKAWGKEAVPTDEEREDQPAGLDTDAQLPPSPIQALTTQIVNRSMYFLTHGSPPIRARILTLLASAVRVLPESSLMPAIHSAWPFILNRLEDPEYFVVSSAAALVEALAINHGKYMFRRVWDDVWPRFHKILKALDAADASSALSRRGPGAIGTESAYTHSHRLYRSIIRTMTASMLGVDPQDSSVWELIVSFRRFLSSSTHEELQKYARDLYIAVGGNNVDAVWLGLEATMTQLGPSVEFLQESKWDIRDNVTLILKVLES